MSERIRVVGLGGSLAPASKSLAALITVTFDCALAREQNKMEASSTFRM